MRVLKNAVLPVAFLLALLMFGAVMRDLISSSQPKPKPKPTSRPQPTQRPRPTPTPKPKPTPLPRIVHQKRGYKMSKYFVAGAGTTAYNTTPTTPYVEAGVYNGLSYFQMDATHFLWRYGTSWVLSSSLGSSPPFAYQDSGGSAATPPLTGWSVGNGTAPAPTLTLAPYRILAGDRYVGTSAHTKPASAADGATFLEEDTKATYLMKGRAWVAAGGTGLTPYTATNTALAAGASLTVTHPADTANKRIPQFIADAFATTSSIPTMTSNTAPAGYIAAESSKLGVGQEAYKALDGDTVANAGSGWISANDGSNGVNSWITIEMPVAKILRRYTIWPTVTAYIGRSPKNWTFQGWNGSAWVTLDTQTNITGWTQNVGKTFDFSNSTAYIKYRIFITLVNGEIVAHIGELQLFERVTGSYPVSVVQSNTLIRCEYPSSTTTKFTNNANETLNATAQVLL